MQAHTCLLKLSNERKVKLFELIAYTYSRQIISDITIAEFKYGHNNQNFHKHQHKLVTKPTYRESTVPTQFSVLIFNKVTIFLNLQLI